MGIFTYFLKNNMTSNDFHTIFTINLNIERIHSILQGCKILKINLDYETIINPNIKDNKNKIKLYKENTNAFAYYIITGILMNTFDKTLQWFDTNNIKLYSFDKNQRQVKIFCYYIQVISKEKNLIDVFNQLNKYSK